MASRNISLHTCSSTWTLPEAWQVGPITLPKAPQVPPQFSPPSIHFPLTLPAECSHCSFLPSPPSAQSPQCFLTHTPKVPQSRLKTNPGRKERRGRMACLQAACPSSVRPTALRQCICGCVEAAHWAKTCLTPCCGLRNASSHPSSLTPSPFLLFPP